MNATLIYFFHTLENIAIAASVTIAAIHFERISILWFLVLILLNGITLKKEKQNED